MRPPPRDGGVPAGATTAATPTSSTAGSGASTRRRSHGTRRCAVAGAWIHLLNGRPEAAEHLADVAERSSFTGDPGDGSASYESSRSLLRAVMARRGPEDMLANASFAVAAERPGSPLADECPPDARVGAPAAR